jgi:hypothetical protein
MSLNNIYKDDNSTANDTVVNNWVPVQTYTVPYSSLCPVCNPKCPHGYPATGPVNVTTITTNGIGRVK